MTPQEFCQQSLQVLSVPCPGQDARGRAPFETLLGFFATDDLSPEVFEAQLRLLADSEVSPCFSRAAARVLELWHGQHLAHDRLALAARRN
jgi:hypothetical protein